MTSATAASSTSLPPPFAAQAQQARADQKLQDMKGALQTLRTVQVSSSSQQKSAAKAKLDALKQRLKMLQMMSGGDPKTLARAAAQLAKEIGQAAKDYAAAGGSPADAAVDAAPLPSAEAPASDAQPSEGPGAPADRSAAPGDADQAGSADDAAAKPNTPQTSTAPAVPGVPGPDPAIEEAKQLAAGARSLLEMAIARAKREHHVKPADFKDERDAMTAADKDIADAAKKVADADTPSVYGPTGQGITAAAAAAAPIASIKA